MSEFNEVAKETICKYLQRREEAVKDNIIVVHVTVDSKAIPMAKLLTLLKELVDEDRIETLDGRHYKISSPANKIAKGKWV